MEIIDSAGQTENERSEAFSEWAKGVAAGAVVTPPTALSPEERRLYVRATLREDHQYRIENRPEGAQAKFDKLASSAWDFFRGTALLFYRDIAGCDAGLPLVLVNGDAHPENFGVMPNEDGAPFFGLNDFDEASIAPFAWDLRRSVSGFFLAPRDAGNKKKACRKTVKAFLDGYFDGLLEFATSDREKSHEYRIDNSPPMIRKLLKSAGSSRRTFLKGLIDLKRGRFVSSEEIVPHGKFVKKFQKVIDRYRKDSDVPETPRAGHFEVKDVAIKKGSGTASLGLDRYFVLIDGPSGDHADDIILELKQTRQSALFGLAPESRVASDEDHAKRIVNSHDIHLVGGDPYYGMTMIDGRRFLVRERSPMKDDIDVDELNKSQWREYSNICGRTLAIAHARCDEDTGLMKGNAEKMILGSVCREVFTCDLVRFAEVAAKRLYRDYRAFQKDHQKGAFQFVDR